MVGAAAWSWGAFRLLAPEIGFSPCRAQLQRHLLNETFPVGLRSLPGFSGHWSRRRLQCLSQTWGPGGARPACHPCAPLPQPCSSSLPRECTPVVTLLRPTTCLHLRVHEWRWEGWRQFCDPPPRGRGFAGGTEPGGLQGCEGRPDRCLAAAPRCRAARSSPLHMTCVVPCLLLLGPGPAC